MDADPPENRVLIPRRNACGELDRELPADKCQSHITTWQEIIVASDDPRWIERDREVVALKLIITAE